jgi:DNA-binding PadR family transcriptional regulator
MKKYMNGRSSLRTTATNGRPDTPVGRPAGHATNQPATTGQSSPQYVDSDWFGERYVRTEQRRIRPLPPVSCTVTAELRSVKYPRDISTSMSEAQAVSNEPGIVRDLTAFQHNILVILSEEPMYGLAIKRQLEEYYGTEVNHGRLYPNLDSLVDMGLVEKSELDKRTNQYELTEDGHEAVLNRMNWVLSKFVTDDDRAESVRDLVETQR